MTDLENEQDYTETTMNSGIGKFIPRKAVKKKCVGMKVCFEKFDVLAGGSCHRESPQRHPSGEA